jgi:UDP-N-acetylmuramoylalanine--D-glutamate ligase
MNIFELDRKSIIIVGFGVEGQSTYTFLRSRWPEQVLAIADRHPYSESEIAPEVRSAIEHDTNLRLIFGSDYMDYLAQYEIAIKTPGISFAHPAIRHFEALGGYVSSHLELFFNVFDRNRIVGVTGTKGKSTTTTLLYQMAVNGGLDVRLGGNIGHPPLSLLQDCGPETVFLLELSSYQLDRLPFSPHIAVLLDLVSEHLGLHEPSAEAVHHRTFDEYVAAKESITRRQGSEDILILNPTHPIPSEIASRSRAQIVKFSTVSRVDLGSFITGQSIHYSDGAREVEIATLSDIPLLGRFNRENVLAAVTAAIVIGVPERTLRESIRSFKPLPHRIQYLGEFNGIRFYDDSIATVPEATLNALDGLGESVQTLIAGGHDRGLIYEALAREIVRSNIRNLILFQPAGRKIWDAVLSVIGKSIPINVFWPDSMEDAVRIAFRVTKPGAICLLSPASSSYGMFKNFADRGHIFRVCVEKLARE